MCQERFSCYTPSKTLVLPAIQILVSTILPTISYMNKDLSLGIIGEYVGLLVLAVNLLRTKIPTSYIISKTVVFDSNVIELLSHNNQLMVLGYLNHYIIILEDC